MLLGSSTLSHLHAGIRLAGLRRGILVDLYQGMYGAYRQELMNRSSGLYSFAPDVIVLAMDSHHLAEPEGASADGVLATLRDCWSLAQQAHCSTVIQQTLLPVLPTYRESGVAFSSPARSSPTLTSVCEKRRPSRRAFAYGGHLGTERGIVQNGLIQHYGTAPTGGSSEGVKIYGDHVGACWRRCGGKSAKCLVLDLDNTLWGGVVGDDGVDGIVIGEGSESGEAFLAVQKYAKRLSERGVILAVCSKNDERNALRPFEQRSEMILKASDVACFAANWDDKASNLRLIARQLNIGLDSLVLLDDNPVERKLIRRELPMVGVPELPEDPQVLFDVCLPQATSKPCRSQRKTASGLSNIERTAPGRSYEKVQQIWRASSNR